MEWKEIEVFVGCGLHDLLKTIYKNTVDLFKLIYKNTVDLTVRMYLNMFFIDRRDLTSHIKLHINV